MNDLIIPNVNSGMETVIDDISRLHIRIGNSYPFICLCIGRPGKADSKMRIDRLNKSGTVASIGKRSSSPDIRIPDKLARIGGNRRP